MPVVFDSFMFSASGRWDPLGVTHWIADVTARRLPEPSRVSGPSATRSGLEDALVALALGDGVVMCAHGTADAVLGSDDRPALDASNAYLLAGRWAHAIACCAGERLADSAANAGAACFVGYRETIRADWAPALQEPQVQDMLEELVTAATLGLASGCVDPVTLANLARVQAEKILEWIDGQPEPGRHVALRELAGRLWRGLTVGIATGGTSQVARPGAPRR